MRCQVFLSVITTVLETFIYAGVLYGWSSIYPVLISEGFFKEQCLYNNQCQEQQNSLSLVFSIASGAAPILNLLTGVMLDKVGTWVTRTILIVISAVGFLITAFAVPGRTSSLLYVSFPLIGFGGYGLLTTNIQSANLTPLYRASVASLVSGSFDSSAVIFLVINKIYFGAGVRFNVIFYALAACGVLLIVRTFLLTPKTPPPYVLPRNYRFGYEELCRSSADYENQHDDAKNEDTDVADNPDVKSLQSSLQELHTWSNVIHFAFIQFSIIYFIGNFNTWITTRVSDTSLYTTVFALILFCGLLLAPLGGFLVDFSRKRFDLPPHLATLKAVAVTQLIGDVFTLLMLACALVPLEQIQYVTFVMTVAARAFLYGTMAAFVSVSYPSQHFGVIYGLTVAIGGVTLLLQYPLHLLVSTVLGNNFVVIYAALLGLCCLATVHPFYLLWYAGSREPQETASSKVGKRHDDTDGTRF